MVIYDELHAAPNRDLWDVLTTSTGSRAEPLVIAITTAGFDRHSICWEQHEYARRLLDGTVTDPTFLPVIYGAPDDADWTDEHVWKACNPALEDFRDLDEMRAMAHRAREDPGAAEHVSHAVSLPVDAAGRALDRHGGVGGLRGADGLARAARARAAARRASVASTSPVAPT